MKRLSVILLVALMLSPSLGLAKVIKLGEDTFVNESAIIELNSKENSCSISYLYGGNVKSFNLEMSCKDFLNQAGIEILNEK
ncbi:MAG: hypothetical protein LBH40_06085 [Alphaproteobacteria bacterium]|jgi:hypothetical protein|nr:hypothetical protein [Alphaproteobacteria bacterium]